MVLNRHGEMLYRGVKQLVVENLESMAKERIIPAFPSGTTDVTVQSSDASLLLVNVKNVWEEHNSNMVRLGQILRYMVCHFTDSYRFPIKPLSFLGSGIRYHRQCVPNL